MFWQFSVGGGVWDQGKVHGEGSDGQGEGYAADGRAHHSDQSVRPVLCVVLLYQLFGVLNRSDRLKKKYLCHKSYHHHYKNLQCQLIRAGVINDGFNVDLFFRDGPVIKLFQSQNKSLHPLESIVVLHWDNFVTAWACVKTKQANKGNKLKRISFFRLDPGDVTCWRLTCLFKQILPVKFWLFIYHWALLSQSLD